MDFSDFQDSLEKEREEEFKKRLFERIQKLNSRKIKSGFHPDDWEIMTKNFMVYAFQYRNGMTDYLFLN